MSSYLHRLINGLVGIDETANALGGGKPTQTISGTVGRACGAAGGKPHWWGPVLRDLIDGMPWFGPGHCENQAIKEANPT